MSETLQMVAIVASARSGGAVYDAALQMTAQSYADLPEATREWMKEDVRAEVRRNTPSGARINVSVIRWTEDLTGIDYQSIDAESGDLK